MAVSNGTRSTVSLAITMVLVSPWQEKKNLSRAEHTWAMGKAVVMLLGHFSCRQTTHQQPEVNGLWSLFLSLRKCKTTFPGGPKSAK